MTDGRRSEAFTLAGHHGEVGGDWEPSSLEEALARCIDPGRAKETLHWGRNYLYTVDIETSTGPVEVVVKQFRNQGWVARLRRSRGGSKAERSWRAAQALQAAGVATPEPLMLIESDLADGPSFYVSAHLRGFFEVRYLFRAIEAGEEEERFAQVNLSSFFAQLGDTLRRLHLAGIWHRDISVGNVLVRDEDPPQDQPEIYLIDLNRVRIRRRLTLLQRMRDLCRLRIFRPQHQEIFLRSYWGDSPRGYALKKALYRTYFYGFLAKVRAKAMLRYPFRRLAGFLRPQRAHVHIPRAPDDAPKRERTAWDPLSDQPYQHATRVDRWSIRLADATDHARQVTTMLRQAPSVWRRYRHLQRHLHRQSVPFTGLGVAIRPWPEAPEKLLRELESLKIRQVLLRLHPWEADQSAAAALAAELHHRDYELAFALPQNRDLVRDLDRWRRSVTAIAETFGPFGRHFQIGQAVNRSKWGIWRYSEYFDLYAAAAEILRQDPEVELMGPATIDFELHATAALVNSTRQDVHFDIVSSLLYVDRRGAPENRQLGFDTVDKVVLLKAIADEARHASPRAWITEVNWPLWEGPHSPAGKAVAVDEESQANYLLRYYLLALGSGLIERVYWWQLVAKGYGLIDPMDDGGFRRRPALQALATLQRILGGSRFEGPLPTAEGVRLYRFTTSDGGEVVVGWSLADRAETELPRPAEEVFTRDGEARRSAGELRVEVGAAPQYFLLTRQ